MSINRTYEKDCKQCIADEVEAAKVQAFNSFEERLSELLDKKLEPLMNSKYITEDALIQFIPIKTKKLGVIYLIPNLALFSFLVNLVQFITYLSSLIGKIWN